MSIKHFIYYTPIIISILSIISIVLAIKNKDKKINKYIIIGDVIFILYLFVISVLLHNLLPIIVDFIILIIWFISFVSVILYLISIIICLIRTKKLNNIIENRKLLKLFVIIVLTPIFLFVISLFKEVYLIHNSTLLLSYYSSSNGTLGDSNNFVYAISDKYCEEISFEIEFLYDYYNKLFLPSNIKEINKNELQKLGYKIVIDDNYITVYKDDDLIHKKSINKKYFNIDLETIYYNE